MSLNHITRELHRFLKSSLAEVLVIRGRWGIGKTYTWDKILKASRAGGISCEKYAYVSLFGVSSLKELKYVLFENTIDVSLIGEEVGVSSMQDNFVQTVKSLGRQGAQGLAGLLKMIPNISVFDAVAPVFDSLAFMSIRDTLICIDDLERRGKALSARDVLGLVSMLKEQRNCKVVFLFNDKEKGLEDFEQNREKVVDVELIFDPTAIECAEIALSKNDDIDLMLVEYVVDLNLRNIRIIKKIERMIGQVKPKIVLLEADLQRRVVKSIALFCRCYYRSGEEDIPEIDYVLSAGYGLYGLDKEEVDKEKMIWKRLLQNYGYRLTGEIEKLLSDFVRRGYIDEDVFDELLKIENDKIIGEKMSDAFHHAWESYHYSFENNQNEVVSGIYDAFRVNVNKISPMNLDGTVTLFRSLDENVKADELIELYVRVRAEERELFNLDDYIFRDQVRDEKLLDAFGVAYSKGKITESLRDVVIKMIKNNGWSRDDIHILAEQSVDDYYDLFKSVTGQELIEMVNRCLAFGDYQNSSVQQKMIAEKAKEALTLIGHESKINKIRVRRHGVELD